MEMENKKLRDVAEIARQIMVGEELKGNQKKIDKNHNGKIDGQDFKILRKEESEEVAEETIEEATPPKNTDIADKSYLKDMGKKPTVKSDLKNLGRFITGKKETNEEVEQIDEVSLKTATSAYVKRAGEDDPSSQMKAVKTAQHIAKQHGVKGVARAAKTADKEYGLNDPVHNPRKEFVKGIMQSVKKEDVDSAAETILEYESKDGKFVHRARPGSYGGTKDEKHAVDTLAGPKAKELKAIESEKKKKMSEMVATYKEQGLKGLFESLKKDEIEVLDEGVTVKKEYDDKHESEHGVYHNDKKIGYIVHSKKHGVHTAYHSPQGDDDYGQIDDYHSHHDAVSQIRHSAGVGVHEEVEQIAEEPTNDEFNAQLDDAKKRAAGTKKQAEVSKPAVQAVQNEETHTIVQVIDFDPVNGVQHSEIDLEERTLTEPETKKKEEIVKSMKKGIAGFKERYGSRAKEVMYATATARAKGE